jgi:hypothetical protein
VQTHPSTPSRSSAFPTLSKAHRLYQAGKVRTGILLWALGIPLPLILLFLLFRGCA